MNEADQRLEIVRARHRADLARMRFSNAFDAALHRLSPERIKDDAMLLVHDEIDQARQDLIRKLRYAPFVLVPLVVGLVAFLFWRPGRKVAKIATRDGARLAQIAWLLKKLWSFRK